jgi:TonB family protein
MVPRRSVCSALLWFATLLAVSPHAEALDAEQVFEKASASVVTVESQDAAGITISFGSGVVIAPGEIITNCHVLRNGVILQVRKEGRSSPAYLHFADKVRDLCQLQAAPATSFTRPVRGLVAMSDLRVGQHVYAIGAPRGLELTLSDGLISGLRHSANGSIHLIQTTAPVSPGSSGGGLFDQDGRLVGITTFILKESQNLNFAVPATWAQELSSKQTDLIEQRRRQQAEGKSGVKDRDAETEPRTSDTGDYARRVQDKIQRLITYPSAHGGQLRAEFAISVMASGWPVRVDLLQSSGDSEFDTKARGAILAASPLHDAQEVHFEGLRNFRVVLSALAAEQAQTKSDDYPALKHFQQDIEARVGSVVSERDYPREARERGWQGLTIVRVTIGQDGRLKSLTVVRSSRFAALDEHAVAKMREIQLPTVPVELAGREFSVDVPFRFAPREREL